MIDDPSREGVGRPPRWSLAGMLIIGLWDLWLRGHVVGPTVAEATGLRLWPVVAGEAEPLDSDEAAYAEIGCRIVRGEVMYRDLVEHKPPGGYWLFALAVGLGGANELTIRLLPVPLVLLALGGIWWLGWSLGGPVAACVAAGVYALLSTDPHLSGDAAILEHPINALAVGSLVLMVLAGRSNGRRRRLALAGAGACVAGACLVRQVVITHMLVYLSTIVIGTCSWRDRLRDAAALLGGFAIVAGAVGGVLAAQGGLRAAYEQSVIYAAAQTAQAPRVAGGPAWPVRWIVGEIDPRDGRLPWPFGDSPSVRWWGTGLWPIWLAMPPALVVLAGVWTSGPRRLLVAWTLSAAVQVALPGLFWQHYYLLLAPGAALAFGLILGDCTRRATAALRASEPEPSRFYVWASAATALGAVLIASGFALARSYLLTPADELQPVFKGGTAWKPLRTIGREIGQRARATWSEPKLFVWGWQSPVYVYSQLPSASGEIFTDPLMEALARTDPSHPLIRPRLERIIHDLEARRPEVVFVGIAPFDGLRALLNDRYTLWRAMPGTRSGEGIWVLRQDADRFAAATAP